MRDEERQDRGNEEEAAGALPEGGSPPEEPEADRREHAAVRDEDPEGKEEASEVEPEGAEEAKPEDAEEAKPEGAEKAKPEGAEKDDEGAKKDDDGAKKDDEGVRKPEGGKKEDLPPGAELEPIAIETGAELGAEEKARLEAEAEERARREAEATAERVEEPAPAPRSPADLAKDARYSATGKRKRSVARVIVTPGGGAIEINSRKLEEYFPRSYLQTIARQPLVQAGYEGSVDVRVRVHGGGVSGQAGAVRHGIARALCEIDPELRHDLKRRGLLTRDARAKERRKAGLKKARKRPQFSKR